MPNGIKTDAVEILQLLINEGVTSFYHVTRSENIPSIRANGGLYSWWHCMMNGIDIAHPGGNRLSRQLDIRSGLQDYVRLSFAMVPPMFYAPEHMANCSILSVGLEVAIWEGTRFSNMNATDRRARIGERLASLNEVRFDIVLSEDETRFGAEHWVQFLQAEVLVKTHVPMRLISIVE